MPRPGMLVWAALAVAFAASGVAKVLQPDATAWVLAHGALRIVGGSALAIQALRSAFRHADPTPSPSPAHTPAPAPDRESPAGA